MSTLGAFLFISALVLSTPSLPGTAQLTSGEKGSCQVKIGMLSSSSVFVANIDFQQDVINTVESELTGLKDCVLPRSCGTSCFSFSSSKGNISGCKLDMAFSCDLHHAKKCGKVDLESLVGKSIPHASGPVYVVAASAVPSDATQDGYGCAAPNTFPGVYSIDLSDHL